MYDVISHSFSRFLLTTIARVGSYSNPRDDTLEGLCLHQCKLPAQQFFKDELGLSLTVSPNFDTQECQWSFGEEPLPPQDDPSFPKGCLVGCESRKQVAKMGLKSDICSV